MNHISQWRTWAILPSRINGGTFSKTFPTFAPFGAFENGLHALKKMLISKQQLCLNSVMIFSCKEFKYKIIQNSVVQNISKRPQSAIKELKGEIKWAMLVLNCQFTL